MKELTKLTNAENKKPLYIDLNRIVSLTIYERNHNGPTAYPAPTNGAVNNCTVVCAEGYSHFVEEHITEIIAMIEGRDPIPSKILFGKKE